MSQQNVLLLRFTHIIKITKDKQYKNLKIEEEKCNIFYVKLLIRNTSKINYNNF